MIRMVKHHVAEALEGPDRRETVPAHSGFGRGRRERGKVIRVEVNVVIVRDASRAGTKRAPVPRQDGTVLAVRGRRHPLGENGIPSEFTHPLSHKDPLCRGGGPTSEEFPAP